MVEFNSNLVYLHKPSLKLDVHTWICPWCVKYHERVNLESVHHTSLGLDVECFRCKIPNLEEISN